MKGLLSLMLGVFVATGSCFAHDLGTQGTVWPIDEPSILVVIMKEMAGIDWQKKSQQMLADAQAAQHHYPDDGLTPARETKTVYIDPSIVTTKAISAPVKGKDGKTRWQVLYPAGTKVNPLKKIQPVTRLLVFDPNIPDQVDFAIAALHAYPLMIELTVSGGDLKGVSKTVDRPVYYANSRIVKRFGLTHTPSLVGVGEGEHAYQLAVTQFGPAQANGKQAVAAVRRAWYGLETPPRENTPKRTSSH